MPPSSDPPPPDATNLHQAALSYLARYASTEAALRRVLMKRVDRWAQAQQDRESAAQTIAAARDAIDDVVASLAKAGAVSDAGFAEGRARSLVRAGRSRRAIQARLQAKGVASGLARDAAGDDETAELAAALILVRRRRLGSFRSGEAEDMAAVQRKELGTLARAGFTRETAQKALEMGAEEAERLIHALRSDQAISV